MARRFRAGEVLGAGVPVGEVARAPGRGRGVRAGRTVARFAVFRLRHDAGAVRRETEEGARSARRAGYTNFPAATHRASAPHPTPRSVPPKPNLKLTSHPN